MRRPRPLLFVSLLLAAGAAAAAAGQPLGSPPETTGQTPRIIPASDLSPADASEIEALFAAAAAVVRSPEFAANLSAVAARLDLRMAPEGAAVAPADLASMLRGDRPGVGYAPARVEWRRFGRSRTFLRDGVLVIQLKRGVRSSWRSTDARTRACAVNTAAHEISHMLTATPTDFAWLIVDWGYEDAPETQHFASYTTGSVAQCTWLQQQGALEGPIGDCVARNGTREYTPHC